MANRVVIGAFDGTYVLRTSQPGNDVLNAGLTPNQLSFDSRWSEIGNWLSSGRFVWNHDETSKTITYGQTFSSPPSVLAWVSGTPNDLSQWWMATRTNYNWHALGLRIFNDQFTIHRHMNSYPGTRTVFYIILRNNYG